VSDDRDWVRGDWMQTWSGGRFYPRDPRSADVDPTDIAHALSLLCRYGGHVERFYSVAEHCVLMSQAVAPENALAALLHDATEAYVGDVVRPLKLTLPGYRHIEHQVWLAIAHHFELGPLPEEVKEADNRILINERAELLTRAEPWPTLAGLQPLPVQITGWAPALAEALYLNRLTELTYELTL
jgi:hypothetical protein